MESTVGRIISVDIRAEIVSRIYRSSRMPPLSPYQDPFCVGWWQSWSTFTAEELFNVERVYRRAGEP